MSIVDYATIAASFLAIAWLVKTIGSGAHERHAEDDNRAFFDEHAHWPDEDPSEGERRRAEARRITEAERRFTTGSR